MLHFNNHEEYTAQIFTVNAQYTKYNFALFMSVH